MRDAILYLMIERFHKISGMSSETQETPVNLDMCILIHLLQFAEPLLRCN